MDDDLLPVPEEDFLTPEQAASDPTVDVRERDLAVASWKAWRRWRERRQDERVKEP